MTGPRKSPRELAHELEKMRDEETAAKAAGDMVVEWRDAAPDERPDGMTWRPASDDEPALLAYDVWEAQRATLEAVDSGEHDVVAFLAGYGSGKSVFGARWLLAQALEHPGSRFLAMGVDFQKARDTTYPKLFAQLPGERTTLTTSGYNGPENSPLVADYNRQEHRLTLTNDSVITLGSADKYSRYAGAEFGAVWMDEPSHYGEVLHDLTGMITTRLRGVAGPKTQLWTLTGEGYNAAWEILEQRQDADGDPIGLDIEVVRASVLDNPYLTEGDKERFKRKYEGTAKEEQALHGGFAAATGLVYSNFSRETHVIDPSQAHALVEDDWRMYGYDSGWNDPRVLLEVGKTPYGQYVVLDEFYQSNTHVEDAIAWLERKNKPEGTIYSEHVPAEIEKFQRAGWRVEKADKDIDAGISEVRKRLETDGTVSGDVGGSETGGLRVIGGMNELLNRGSSRSRSSRRRNRDESRDEETGSDENAGNDQEDQPDVPDGVPSVGLLVSADCEHLVREFLGYKEEHVGTSQATDHAVDSLRYCLTTGGGGGIPTARAHFGDEDDEEHSDSTDSTSSGSDDGPTMGGVNLKDAARGVNSRLYGGRGF